MHKVLIINNYQEIVEEPGLKIESFTLTPLEWLIKVKDPEQENIILLNLKRDIRKIRSDAKVERIRLVEEAAATAMLQRQVSVSNQNTKDDIKDSDVTQTRQITENNKPIEQEINIQSQAQEHAVVPASILLEKELPPIIVTTITPVVEVAKQVFIEEIVFVKEPVIQPVEKLITPPSQIQNEKAVNVEKKQVDDPKPIVKQSTPPGQLLIAESKINSPDHDEKGQQQINIEPANNQIKKSLTSKESNKGKRENTLSSVAKPVGQNDTFSRLKQSLIDYGTTEDRHMCEMSLDDESIQFNDGSLLDNKTFREHLEKTSKLIDMKRETSPPPLIPDINNYDNQKKSFHDSLYERSNTQLNSKLQPNEKNKLQIQGNSRRDTKTPVDRSKSPAFQKLIKKPNYAIAKPQASLSISPPLSQTRKNTSISPTPQKNKQKSINKSIKERSVENTPKRDSEQKRSTLKIREKVSPKPQINLKTVKVEQKQNKEQPDKKVSARASIKQKQDVVQTLSPKKDNNAKTTEITGRTSIPPQSVRSISVTQTTNSGRGVNSMIKISPIKLPVTKSSVTPQIEISATRYYKKSERLQSKISPQLKVQVPTSNFDYKDHVKSTFAAQKGGESPSLIKNKQTKIRKIKKASPERSLDSASPRRTTLQLPQNKRLELEWFSSIMQSEIQKECSHGQKMDQIKEYLQNARTTNQVNIKRKSPRGSPRRNNQSLEHRESAALNESVAIANEQMTQESIAGRTLETDFYEDTERPSAAVQSRYQKELLGADLKYNPADKYRNFKKQRTVQQSSKQNRILTIQEPPIESQSINVSKNNKQLQQDGPVQEEDVRKFTFNRSGTKQIKDGQNNDKNDIFRQLSPGNRAQSSPKALRAFNPQNQLFMPGDQLQVPQIKLPDFKKKLTIGNATTAVNTNNNGNQVSQDTLKSSLMKTADIFQIQKDEIIVMNVDIESQMRQRRENPLSQISKRPHSKAVMSPGGPDLVIKKKAAHKLEPIDRKGAGILENIKNDDKIVTIGKKEGLTYPEFSVNFSDGNNSSLVDEASKKFGHVSPFLQHVGGGPALYPRASSHLSKTGNQHHRFGSLNSKLFEAGEILRDNLNQTQFHSIQENGEILGKPRKIKRRQFVQHGISQTKNESPLISMFFQDSARGGGFSSVIENRQNRDISPLTANNERGQTKFVYPLIGCANGSQGPTKANNTLFLPSTIAERKNASTLREAKTANKFFQTPQITTSQ